MSNGGSLLVKERLETFAAVFQSDSRPALVFDHGRLVLANDAAHGILDAVSCPAVEQFLSRVKVSLSHGNLETDLIIQTPFGVYVPAMLPPRTRSANSTVICFLKELSIADPESKSLSKRERGVLELLIKGLTNGQIGQRLGISIETVRKHIAHSLEKTGMRTRAGLVGHALER